MPNQQAIATAANPLSVTNTQATPRAFNGNACAPNVLAEFHFMQTLATHWWERVRVRGGGGF
jgi:hypothetical protein